MIFSRTELLLGEENLEKLRKSRVAVFGIGGVGGYVCEALARSGRESVTLLAAILGGVREFGAKSMVFVFLALCVAFSSVFCAGKVKDKNQKSFSYANGAEYAVRAEITLVSYVSAYRRYAELIPV